MVIQIGSSCTRDGANVTVGRVRVRVTVSVRGEMVVCVCICEQMRASHIGL